MIMCESSMQVTADSRFKLELEDLSEKSIAFGIQSRAPSQMKQISAELQTDSESGVKTGDG